MSRLKLLIDIKDFLVTRKKFWLMPIVLVPLLVALRIFNAESTALSPFIYILF